MRRRRFRGRGRSVKRRVFGGRRRRGSAGRRMRIGYRM